MTPPTSTSPNAISDKIDVIPFEARRFKSAAQHYLTGRPAYPARLIEMVARLCSLPPTGHVLDLGCGPGQLAMAFAPLAGSVLAVDPEPEMLALCQQQAVSRGYHHIETRQGSSQDLDASFGRFDLVMIGRAFHWMDRVATLRQLDQLIVPGGAIVLFADRHPRVPANAWQETFNEIVDRYAAVDPGRAMRKSPNWVRHEAVLLDSPFNRLERHAVLEEKQLPLEQIVERALSRSSTSSDRLGKAADEMVAELRARLLPEAGADMLTEVVEAEALVARRMV
ncbi:MAG TPA: class I SAM-dependent methyltransferase [Dongiaceae bacterium]|nr:class I SAM-dependent methyltransferase [Dongiaceae bacterium]